MTGIVLDATTSIEAAALTLNAVAMLIGLVWSVASIKANFAKQIAAEHEETLDQFAKLKETFLKDQQAQDHNFGEVGLSLRQYMANIEKEMHTIEIWSRDHFSLKVDVIEFTDRLREDIKSLGTDIRSDLRDLNAKIDGKHGVH